jgi:Leucine-rich repeat (LRR) protein
LLLYDRAISGTIPSEISLLSSLSGLELTNTFLTGAIPTELGLLAKLQRLSLEHNRLTDTIPSVLGQLGLIVVGVVPRK